MGKLFYIMGKSASGKDTIYQRLLRNPEFSLERLVIYTTRPIRDGELDGREYHFVTEEDFQKLKAEGKIIEDRGYETVYGLWRYFTADNMNLEEKSYLGIGTLESYEKLKAYYGEEKIRPHLYRSGRRRTPEAGDREGRDCRKHRNMKKCAGDFWQMHRISVRKRSGRQESPIDFPIWTGREATPRLKSI